ncbi:PAP2 family protein [Salmonella enterica]|nr:PAP2 family protein [Salmonella enterica]
MPYLSNKRLLAEMSIALVMAIVATLTLEHSQIDLMVADWFYLGMGHWMVAKQAFLPDLLLYSGLKKLLMAMLIYLLVATICRAYHEKKGNAITAKWLVPVTKFRVRELAYLVLTLILVPTVVASLKAYTHVVCPVHLTIFDGTLPYLPMLDSMRNTIPDKCFPAAHASSGFALFAFAFAPSLRRRRGAIIIVVMALGWAMGCYKMIIGDHFLSHTVVSMMLAWAMSAGLAWVFFKKGEQVKRKNIKLLTQAKLRLTTLLSRPLKAGKAFSLMRKNAMYTALLLLTLSVSSILTPYATKPRRTSVLKIMCSLQLKVFLCRRVGKSWVKIPKKTMRRMRKYKPALIYLCYRSMMMVCVSLQASIRKQRLLLATSRIQRYLLQ